MIILSIAKNDGVKMPSEFLSEDSILKLTESTGFNFDKSTFFHVFCI
jgi:hypothetical protein